MGPKELTIFDNRIVMRAPASLSDFLNYGQYVFV